jgi:hypothetical protein
MKISTITFLLIFTSLSGFSQNTLPEFKHKKDSLIKIKSDLVVDFHLSLGGMFIPEIDEDCSENEPRYLFWILNNKFYKQKFSECRKYPQVQIKNSDLLTTILNNLNEINKTELRPVQSDKIVQVEIDHQDIWYFNINTPKISFDKTINLYELETKDINDEETNINYEFNQSSILNKLIKLAQKEEY